MRFLICLSPQIIRRLGDELEDRITGIVRTALRSGWETNIEGCRRGSRVYVTLDSKYRDAEQVKDFIYEALLERLPHQFDSEIEVKIK
jgi:hypothetical protein